MNLYCIICCCFLLPGRKTLCCCRLKNKAWPREIASGRKIWDCPAKRVAVSDLKFPLSSRLIRTQVWLPCVLIAFWSRQKTAVGCPWLDHWDGAPNKETQTLIENPSSKHKLKWVMKNTPIPCQLYILYWFETGYPNNVDYHPPQQTSRVNNPAQVNQSTGALDCNAW